ncbi:NifX-associated nitrogen fixation protein [Wolinella succinogenes]|uniref:NifX-associated nitrogen fixation protein n=1 Tax=Wolinella succinogenes TaxID=844 RepID=UPI002FCC21FA
MEGVFKQALIDQFRALDAYGHWNRLSDEELLGRLYIREKGASATCAEVDEATTRNIKLYYQALAVAFEKRCGEMANVMMELNSEGYGRILVIVGRLIVLDKTIRDASKFGFGSLEELDKKGGSALGDALKAFEKYRSIFA